MDYAWPGSIRELEQCVRNILIRKPDRPKSRDTLGTSGTDVSTPSPQMDEEFVKALLAGELSLEELTQTYVTHVYRQTGRYDLAATKLRVNWRTVRSKVR
ncbi:MAG: hypothetical protein MUF23_18230 [Pirellula sp.]|nr:hypothetical protein [Pirellula sp.]